MERENVLQQCPAVVSQAWPICFQRVTTLFSVIDPTYVSAPLARKIVRLCNRPSTDSLIPHTPIPQAGQRQSRIATTQLGAAKEDTVGEPTRLAVAPVEEPSGDGDATGAADAKRCHPQCIARPEP